MPVVSPSRLIVAIAPSSFCLPGIVSWANFLRSASVELGLKRKPRRFAQNKRAIGLHQTAIKMGRHPMRRLAGLRRLGGRAEDTCLSSIQSGPWTCVN